MIILTPDKATGLECSTILHLWEGGSWEDAWYNYCESCGAQDTCNILKGTVEVRGSASSMKKEEK